MNLISLLHSENVQDIYFASGARNAGLIEFFNDFTVHQGYDERSMAFQALGRSKATSKPVVICTTSGTAVIETLPALVEAYFSGEKIIIIAADRPQSLDNSFAPQMIDQKNILSVYSRSFFDLSDLSDFNDFGDNNQGSDIEYPMTINIRVNLEGDKPNSVRYIDSREEIDIPGDTLFILGSFSKLKQYEELYQKIIKSAHFIYQEVESPFYSKTSMNEILHDELLQSLLEKKEIKHIVRIGRCPNSKAWRRIHNFDVSITHIDPFNKPCQKTGQVVLDIESYMAKMVNTIQPGQREVINYSSTITNLATKYAYSEFNYFNNLFSQFKFDTIYCGNSMPIRYLKFFKPKQKVVANRGANGIDGLISSAIGYANGTDEEVVLLIGDLSTFYDLSALVEELPANLKIFIFNNFGGQIFDLIHLDHVKNEHKFFISEVISGFSKKVSVVMHPDDLVPSHDTDIYELVIANEDNRGFWNEYRRLFS